MFMHWIGFLKTIKMEMDLHKSIHKHNVAKLFRNSFWFEKRYLLPRKKLYLVSFICCSVAYNHQAFAKTSSCYWLGQDEAPTFLLPHGTGNRLVWNVNRLGEPWALPWPYTSPAPSCGEFHPRANSERAPIHSSTIPSAFKEKDPPIQLGSSVS